MTIFTPTSPEEVLATVAWAVAEETPLEVVGHGSKRAIGRPMQNPHTLDLSGLSGVTLYEPEELVLSARAGTPLAEIEKLLAEHRQQLAFEPMDYAPLLGGTPGRGTLGGVLAANLSGPRRIKAGAARDHILGVHAVSGRGEAFKSGGRVVKNVTGYDLPKLLTGAYGTLAVMTEITLKVLPVAEDVETLLVSGLSDQRAIEALALGSASAWDVSAAAHFPAKVAAKLPIKANAALTAFRLEGIAPSIAYRRDKLEALLKPFGALAALKADESRALWRATRDVLPFAQNISHALWRISVTPTLGGFVAVVVAVPLAVTIVSATARGGQDRNIGGGKGCAQRFGECLGIAAGGEDERNFGGDVAIEHNGLVRRGQKGTGRTHGLRRHRGRFGIRDQDRDVRHAMEES